MAFLTSDPYPPPPPSLPFTRYPAAYIPESKIDKRRRDEQRQQQRRATLWKSAAVGAAGIAIVAVAGLCLARSKPEEGSMLHSLRCRLMAWVPGGANEELGGVTMEAGTGSTGRAGGSEA